MIYQLAQLNIAKFRLPAEHPVNIDFVDKLDQINAVAETEPGFVWRFVGSENNALDVQAFEDPNIAVNMSVWSDIESLVNFVYKTKSHRQIMRRKIEWFDKLEFHMVLWWIESSRKPTIEEAKFRLELLRSQGPTYSAFTFKKPFAAPINEIVDPFTDKCA